MNWTSEIIASDFVFPLNTGWNIMPYSASESINSTQYLSSITSSIIIVKDEIGNAYLPNYIFNNIGALQHGKAYYIKVSEALDFQY